MNFYRPGALSTHPYDVKGNHGLPWLYLAILPFAALPATFSKGFLTLGTIAVCAIYLKGNRRKIMVLCLTMPFLATIAFGQVDALALIGLMLPANCALIFLSMKPQAAALAMFKSRLTPAGIGGFIGLIIGSFLVWGWWPPRLLAGGIPYPNYSLWPYGIPFGVALFVWQWRRGFDSDAALCVATLLLSPYLFLGSLLPATAAAIKELSDRRALAAVIMASWLFVVVRVGL